jgi:hypothetical protein
MSNRVTAREVHDRIRELREELNASGLYSAALTWQVQESSATYGRAWRLFLTTEAALPLQMRRQLGGGSWLGNTNREALECLNALHYILRAIVETREETQRDMVELYAAQGVTAAVLTLELMRDGLPFADALAASSALTVTA